MKYGFLLLSANPLHVGHIAIASKCINDGILDEIFIVPTVQNPWKERPIGTFDERCQMIRNVCQLIDHCHLEDIEKYLFPPYYSCNTLDALYKKYDGDNNDLCIVGGVISS